MKREMVEASWTCGVEIGKESDSASVLNMQTALNAEHKGMRCLQNNGHKPSSTTLGIWKSLRLLRQSPQTSVYTSTPGGALLKCSPGTHTPRFSFSESGRSCLRDLRFGQAFWMTLAQTVYTTTLQETVIWKG